MFEKGYYTLAEIIAMLNQMQYTSFSISNAITSFGCIQMNYSCSIDFSQAPDIIDILGLTETVYVEGSHTGTNIVNYCAINPVVYLISAPIKLDYLSQNSFAVLHVLLILLTVLLIYY